MTAEDAHVILHFATDLLSCFRAEVVQGTVTLHANEITEKNVIA
jgi:hypothetical protein